MPEALDRCIKDVKRKQPDLSEDQYYAICWSSIKKTHKKVKGKWVRMSDTREFKEELSFKIPAEYKYTPPTKDEVIAAINSVPSILDKEKLIEQMDERVRLIKGLPVLTEGKFNRVNYSPEVLEAGADTWNMNPEKPGSMYKVKLEHDKNVRNRAGHLLKSGYDGNYVKHDILLTTKESVEMWDGGLLDDVSVRMRVGIDKKNAVSDGLDALYIKGVGVDFVDNPACKQCGVNAELEAILSEIEDEDMEDKNMSGEDKDIELSEEELTLFEKFKKKLGFEKEEQHSEEDEDEDEEELCGGLNKGGKGKASSKSKKKMDDEEEEMDEDEDEGSEEEVKLEDVLAKVEELEGTVQTLKDENDSLKQKTADEKHATLVDKAMELHAKLDEEVKKEDVEALSDEVLEERISQLKVRGDNTRVGDGPVTGTQLTEEESNKTKAKIKELREELEKKGHKS